MRHVVSTVLGKSVRSLALLRGGGSALPGLFIEKIDPGFTKRTLKTLPQGIVVISGTNGKTTTTKMVVELLEGQGLRVFTNRTGSNFVRGVAAALLAEVDRRGKLHADIAVLELDEAHAVLFVKTIAPRYTLLLNVMRDQLDRFGEIDATAALLQQIAEHTTKAVVINRDDPHLASPNFLARVKAPVSTYGVSAPLLAQFPSDDHLNQAATTPQTTLRAHDDVELQQLNNQTAMFSLHGTTHTTQLGVKGIYNVLNAVGAVALTQVIMGKNLNTTAMLQSLRAVTPAFGRGETVTINGQPCDIVLVKNPAGFRLSLQSFLPEGYATMIAINDDYADGRDMSWLWDVNFESLRTAGVAEVCGVRAYDMALRLQYDEIPTAHVMPSIPSALRHFVTTNQGTPLRIYCSYTAMLAIRRELAHYTKLKAVR
ncbi:MAG: MurT ligase domain-containing protein [Candidatus Saccharimonas sp.]